MGRILLFACAMAVLVAAPAHAATAFDYTHMAGLSQPRYATERTVVHMPSSDGVELYVEIVKPKAPGRWPVIMEASPYHGTQEDRDGTAWLEPESLTGWFAPRGYAVVMLDLRGTGRSSGCLDMLGPSDAHDLKLAVEWAASQPWSNGRVGMVGGSYDAATTIAAAAQHPKGLATIVPTAGFGSMYDIQFQAGVPFAGHWYGTMYIYEQYALERKLPGNDDFPNHMEETACGAAQSPALTGADQVSGRYSAWDAARDWRAQATAADIPVFAIHGVNDSQVRVSALDWFTRRRRPGDKLWLGPWDHRAGTLRGVQFRYALLAWFDRQLAGRPVDTGPPLEAFLSDAGFIGASAGDRHEVLRGTRWPPAADALTFHATADGTLTTAEAAAGTRSFAGSAGGYGEDGVQAGAEQGREFAEGVTGVDPPATVPHDGAWFQTEPMHQDLLLVGVPTMRLAVSVTVPRVDLIATLYDVPPDREPRRISQFAIQPELRTGLDRVDPVIPGTRYDLAPPGFAMAQHLHAGHRLALRVSTSDADKQPTFTTDPNVTVFTGPGATELTVPVVDDPVLAADTVPLTDP